MAAPSKGYLLIVSAVLGSCLCAARGNVITYEVVVDNGGANFACGAGGTFQLPQFDDRGGERKLCWMALSVAANALGGSAALDNENGGSGGQAAVGIGAGIHVRSETILTPLALDLAPWQSRSGYLAGDDPAETGTGGADFTGPDSLATDTPLVTDHQFLTLDAASEDLSEFIGTGCVTYGFTSRLLALYESEVLPFETSSTDPRLSFVATVIYGMEVYPEAPEPASLGLLALGMMRLLWRPRRTGRRPARRAAEAAAPLWRKRPSAMVLA
jgi:hypothetical protein